MPKAGLGGVSDAGASLDGEPLYQIHSETKRRLVDYEWLNEPAEKATFLAGPIENPYHPFVGTGFPASMEPPRIEFRRRGAHVDFRLMPRSMWLVSGSAKSFLERLDGPSFVFAQVIPTERSVREIISEYLDKPYWISDLTKYSESLDFSSDNLSRSGEFIMPKLNGIARFEKYKMEGDLIFRLASAPSVIMCSDIFKVELEARRLTGFETVLRGVAL